MPKINRIDKFHAHETRSYYRHKDGSISSYLKCTAVWWSHCYCHGNYKGERKMQKDIFWSTDFLSSSMISMVLICRLPIMPLAQHRNLRYLRCQSGRSASRTVKLWVRSPKYLCYFTSFSPDTTSRLDVYRTENIIPYMLWGWAGNNSFSSSENNPMKKKTKEKVHFHSNNDMGPEHPFPINGTLSLCARGVWKSTTMWFL